MNMIDYYIIELYESPIHRQRSQDAQNENIRQFVFEKSYVQQASFIKLCECFKVNEMKNLHN